MNFTKIFAASALLCLAVQAHAADVYKIDPMHSSLEFSVQHLVISHVKGKFDKFEGAITLDNGALTSAEGTIQAATVDTGVAPRDKHLRSEAFFDVEKYPTISFKSKSVEKRGDEVVMVGDFTMHGVTKELTLTGEVNGPIKSPMGERVGMQFKTKLNRKDFGLTYNQLLETGGAMVGEEIDIEINAEGSRQQ